MTDLGYIHIKGEITFKQEDVERLYRNGKVIYISFLDGSTRTVKAKTVAEAKEALDYLTSEIFDQVVDG